MVNMMLCQALSRVVQLRKTVLDLKLFAVCAQGVIIGFVLIVSVHFVVAVIRLQSLEEYTVVATHHQFYTP